ncbi:MAG: hypothetical protein LBK95_20080 [Bifidobacteriaceae bacterium]|jgi:hypothetical protein|nr:hypothetical protein [Bifidobacteriaceae bacterium]
MIVTLIIACEIGFWVLIASGLAARYLLGAKKLGAVLLALSPVIDLVLLVATAIDLRGGGEPGAMHGLAALYIGLSVAHGHAMIKWADQRAAYWSRRGPKPPTLYGNDYAAICWKGFARTVAGCLVAWALIIALGHFADNPEATQTLNIWVGTLKIIAVIDGLRALSYTIWPRKPAKVAATR